MEFRKVQKKSIEKYHQILELHPFELGIIIITYYYKTTDIKLIPKILSKTLYKNT